MSDDWSQLSSLNNQFLCGNFSNKAGQEYGNYQPQNLDTNLTVQKLQQSRLENGAASFFSILNNTLLRWQDRLKVIGHNIAADFRPFTKDTDFLREFIDPIWDELISRAYFGTVYVGYGNDLLQVERTGIEKQGIHWYSNVNYFPESKFRLYILENPNEMTYRSVWTQVGNLKIKPERLVAMRLGKDNEFFARATKVVMDDLAGDETFLNCYHMAIKQVVVDVQDNNKFEAEREQLIKSKDPFFILNNQGDGGSGGDLNENDYDEFKSIDPKTVSDVWQWQEMWKAKHIRDCALFGSDTARGGKQDNIQSVMIDMKGVNNMRVYIQQLLRGYMAGKRSEFGRKFPIWKKDFDVYLNSTMIQEEQRQYDEQWKHNNNGKYWDHSAQGKGNKDFSSNQASNRNG